VHALSFDIDLTFTGLVGIYNSPPGFVSFAFCTCNRHILKTGSWQGVGLGAGKLASLASRAAGRVIQNAVKLLFTLQGWLRAETLTGGKRNTRDSQYLKEVSSVNTHGLDLIIVLCCQVRMKTADMDQ
jgi:hypothetical protein